MEKIIRNPGLQHLAEKVFWNLNAEDLKNCAQINQSCKQILLNPIFCLKKFKGLSKENRKDWIKVILSVKYSDKGIAIISYLKWNLKKDIFVDIPCYTSPDVQTEFRKKLWEICGKKEASDEDMEIVKILTLLTDNANAPDERGNNPIHVAAQHGHTEIIKFLVPLADNPNAPNVEGYTPIYWAANYGHTEIVKILAPLTENPNASNADGSSPIHVAAHHGHTEIIQILASLTDNPNAADRFGFTPIHEAELFGFTEIVKILASFGRQR